MLVDPFVVLSSAQFNADAADYEIVGRSRKPQEFVNGYDIIIAMMQKWQLERGYFLHQSDGNNCGPVAYMKIMKLFHVIDVEEAHEVYKKKNICRFVMDEWDRLVERCSNDLPVTVSEKLIDGTFELCFCCVDSLSMEVTTLPCCKASVHRHCVLEALKSNDQCVYCRKVLDPQDIINCTPQLNALSGQVNVSQTTTFIELKAPPEANTSGEANISQTTTLPELKAPPEAHMSQTEISAKLNPPNILGEPPVQDEDKNTDKQPVEAEERSLSGHSTFGKNKNNGLLFAPTCILVLTRTSISQCPKQSVSTNGIMSALIALESMLFFPWGCFIVDTTMTNSTQFSYKCNYTVPQPSTAMSYDSHNPL